MITVYRRISTLVRLTENTVLLLSLALLIGLTVLQILLRNFVSISLVWIEPLNQHLVLVIAFVGTMIAGRKSEHISFDVFKAYFPERFSRYCIGIGSALSALVCFWLAYICAQMVYLDVLDPLPAFAQVPQWVFEVVIPLGLFVIGYRLLKAIFIDVEQG